MEKEYRNDLPEADQEELPVIRPEEIEETEVLLDAAGTEDAVRSAVEVEDSPADREQESEAGSEPAAGHPDREPGPESESPADAEEQADTEDPADALQAQTAPAGNMPGTPAGKEQEGLPARPADPAGQEALPAASDDPAGQKSGGGNGGGHRIPAFWISLLVVLALLGGIYGYGVHYCNTHFMPGTRINGYHCGGMTDAEVEEVFAEAAKDYVLNLRFRGGDTEMIRAKEMGFAYQSDGSVTALLQEQDEMLWPKYFLEEAHYEIKPGGTYDPDLLLKALQALPELQEENMEKPENAYIQFRDGEGDEDGKFVIVPDTEGSTIDSAQLAAGAGDAAASYEDIVDAEEISGAYVPAEIRADDAKLVARCEDLNEIVGASITYVQPDGDTLKLNADVMKDWLVKDKSGKLVKDDEKWDEKLWEFLEKLAVNCNTIGQDHRFHSTLRGEITVRGGYYGYMVNQISEHDKLVKDLAAGVKETRKPDYYIRPYSEETENDGIGTTYVEVDLGAQHVWCYVNGQLRMECDCVSGNTADGHGTQEGVWSIMFMKKDATLRGVMQSNGKYEYETKVSYWMPFYTDTGFHDAWWRTAFGGTIYQNNGSHGCVNLPVDGAEQLFSLCEEKMPVVVYN